MRLALTDFNFPSVIFIFKFKMNLTFNLKPFPVLMCKAAKIICFSAILLLEVVRQIYYIESYAGHFDSAKLERVYYK